MYSNYKFTDLFGFKDWWLSHWLRCSWKRSLGGFSVLFFSRCTLGDLAPVWIHLPQASYGNGKKQIFHSILSQARLGNLNVPSRKSFRKKHTKPLFCQPTVPCWSEYVGWSLSCLGMNIPLMPLISLPRPCRDVPVVVGKRGVPVGRLDEVKDVPTTNAMDLRPPRYGWFNRVLVGCFFGTVVWRFRDGERGKQVEVEDILCREEGIHYGVFLKITAVGSVFTLKSVWPVFVGDFSRKFDTSDFYPDVVWNAFVC